ncbi:MAG: 16S rRNA (guanine(966)-N(2))-methyltransferase RsmD [Planctomycetes bacterium]|nr:16S rRNA (guanine(966)-N(2))-methyltransferase RsmD [Planctomycetota bacterium]
MRIIAGEHRGRLLKTPDGMGTRPMLDRVREAVFSTIGERVIDARVLDLFAGTGSLGLEALSRGALEARLVERDPRVLDLLRRNVEDLALEDRGEIVAADALATRSWGGSDARFELVFFDSPYPMLETGKTRTAIFAALEKLVTERIVSKGLVVFHAPKDGVQENEFAPKIKVELREYGTNAIFYLERK